MKKLSAILICFTMCLVFCGCNNTKKHNIEARAVLTKVLNKEKSFTVHNAYMDRTTEENLVNFKYPTHSNALNIFVPTRYTFTDFDADGIDELLIIDAYLSNFLFLRYDNGKVYGYVYNKISTQYVKMDGSFMTFNNRYKAISRISFSGSSFKITNKAYINNSEKCYLLNENPVESSKVQQYFENWNKTTTKVFWQDIN